MDQFNIKIYTKDEILAGYADDYNKFCPKALVETTIRDILDNCSRTVRRVSEMQNALCNIYAHEVRKYKYKHCMDKAVLEYKKSVEYKAEAFNNEGCPNKVAYYNRKSDRSYRHSQKWMEIATEFKEIEK